jgi:hypothetical protein
MENRADGVQTDTALRLVQKKDIDIFPSTGMERWELQPHVCKICFGRMASRAISEEKMEVLCTNCGATSEQENIAGACCCGITVRKRNGIGRSGGPLVDAGLRCVANPSRSPSFPSMYIAQEVVKKSKV